MIPSIERERAYVRELATRVAEIAVSDESVHIQRRWRDVNGLRKPDRAPVWCRPVGAWAEILPKEALECTDPWLRSLETYFRRILIKHDIGDDSPVYSWFPVQAVFDIKPSNVWRVDVRRKDPGAEGGAWAYDPPLKTGADMGKLTGLTPNLA